MPTHPIHHITAIASSPQDCVDFYTQVLGLRLVKKSVNQDQVEAYHLFFGDRLGHPGMDLTFFTFEPIIQGVRGAGAVTMISLAVPAAAIEWWQQRFKEFDVDHQPLTERFGQQRLVFFDPDGQRLELVGLPDDQYQAAANDVWQTDQVTTDQAIAAFHSARLSVASLGLVEPVLTQILGFEPTATQDAVHLFELPDVARAGRLEVEEHPSQQPAQSGAGTVHHIAFQVEDLDQLQERRRAVQALGLYPTQVIDRFYFQSVYFQTPAGILFELATLGPGFTADEPAESLGQKLALPPFLEDDRAEIEAQLEPIKT